MLGAAGLWVLGDANGRTGRGLRRRRESELDEVDMTEAFLLRSAKVGEKACSDGECSERSTDSIQQRSGRIKVGFNSV